jgi:outer membrane lipoprotein-sorting protein
VEESSDLGLPSLPGTSGASLSWQSLITGSHTARIWVASPHQARLALLGDLAESDLVRDGSDVWVWSSSDSTVQHLVLPQKSDTASAPVAQLPATIDPTALAQKALAAIDPTTSVTVDGTSTVAGRPVYELVLAPKGDGSLISQVRIALDSTTWMPLRAQVFAVGQDSPALQSAFTSITFATPDSSVFAFTPPPGATVTTRTLPARSTSQPDSGAAAAAGRSLEPRVIGSGWTSVLEVHGLSSLLQSAAGSNGASSSTAAANVLLQSATPVSGDFGRGRLLQTSLLSVLLLDDGRVLAGAVTPSVLEQAARASR